MPWLLMLIGFLLLVTGSYLKYRQLRVKGSKQTLNDKSIEDNYIKRSKKLHTIDNELDQLIKSIEDKEKLISKKLDSIVKQETEFKSSHNNTSRRYAQTRIEDSNFKNVLNSHYQDAEKETEKKKNNESVNESENSKYNAVRSLAEQNYNSEYIAKKMNLGIRETELILKLYKKEEDPIA